MSITSGNHMHIYWKNTYQAKMFGKVNVLFLEQGRLCDIFLATFEDLGTGSCVSMSLYVLLEIFSKGFIKLNRPIGRHSDRNAEIVGGNSGFKREKVSKIFWQIAVL